MRFNLYVHDGGFQRIFDQTVEGEEVDLPAPYREALPLLRAADFTTLPWGTQKYTVAGVGVLNIPQEPRPNSYCTIIVDRAWYERFKDQL